MIKRIAAAALCVGMFGSVATADAAVRAGTYKGKTAQGAKVSLKVLSSKKAVIKFAWEGAALGCSDGQTRDIEGTTSPSSVKFPLSRTGKFSFTADRPDGALSFGAAGKIKGSKAAGGLQVQAKVDETNALNPNGPIFCDSDIVAWTAKR
jgi:hypothetical protein